MIGRLIALAVVLASIAVAGIWQSKSARNAAQDHRQLSSTLTPIQSVESTNGWPNLFGPTHDCHLTVNLASTGSDSKPHSIWRKSIGTGYSSPVVWQDDVVVFHRRGNHEVIACLAASDGTTQWEYQYPTHFKCQMEYSSGPYSTPVLDGEAVFTLGAEGKLHALRRSDGAVLWSRDLAQDYDAPAGPFPIGTSPLLEGNLVIVAIGGRQSDTGLVALDRFTGKTVWSATKDQRGYATPVATTIHGLRHVIALTQEAVACINPINGTVRWRVPFCPKNPDIITATTPVVCGDLVLVSAYQAGAMCIRVLGDGSHEIVWSNRRSLDSQHNNLICRDGSVIGFSAREHSLACIDIQTGDWRWRWKSELDRGCLLSAPDELFVFSESGRMGKVQVLSNECVCSSISEPLLPAPCYSAPAWSGGKLYLRNEQELVCFEMPGEAARQE